MRSTDARALGLCVLTGLLAAGCAASPKSYTILEPLRPEQIDVEPWDRLMRDHVRAGHVDYPALCTAPDLPGFRDQVARVKDLDAAPADVRKALYINAYNLYSIQGILDGRSPSSLLGRYGFFLRTRYPVAGEDVTLYDLERDWLKDLGDPRIHFAIICSSASCPRLSSEAFRADRIDRQLDAAAAAFINDRERNRFSVEDGTAELSAIFDWYRDEFVGVAGSLEGYIAGYVEDPGVAARLRDGMLEIGFLDYDWSLNGEPPGPDGRCPEAR